MATLYVCSPRRGDGKTTVAAGLLGLLGRAGLTSYRRTGASSRDAELLRAALGVGDGAAASELVEVDEAAAATGPRLIVSAYRGDQTLEAVRACAADGQTLGVVLSGVPAAQRRVLEREVAPALEGAGLRLLGALPEERRLRGHTVAEVAQFLQGNLLAGRAYLDNLIESYMIGAMSHIGSSGVAYFERFTNKAVVTGGNRIDIHMAALDTPCQALILSGGYDPDPVVIERAEAESCPIVQVDGETVAVIDRIADFLPTLRLSRPEQVSAAADLVRRHVDLGPIESALGSSATATP